jgi:hypothetical protein
MMITQVTTMKCSGGNKDDHSRYKIDSVQNSFLLKQIVPLPASYINKVLVPVSAGLEAPFFWYRFLAENPMEATDTVRYDNTHDLSYHFIFAMTGIIAIF